MTERHTAVPNEPDRVTANQRQIGGAHYKRDRLEHWDLVYILKLDYYQAQIFKYTMRWERKNGVEDLEKAAHVLQKYIELKKLEASGAPHDEIVQRLLLDALKKNLPQQNFGGAVVDDEEEDEQRDHRMSIRNQEADS